MMGYLALCVGDYSVLWLYYIVIITEVDLMLYFINVFLIFNCHTLQCVYEGCIH